MNKIPKIIHYCWFGKNPLSELANRCIKTWQEQLPDYQFIQWDESNFNINSNTFVREAYEAKKWAFVSDFVRLEVLHRYGGIYLDTDIELKKNLDCFLTHEIFFGLEDNTHVSTALFGAEKGNDLIYELLCYYNDRRFLLQNGEYDTTTNVEIISQIVLSKYSIVFTNSIQNITNTFVVYPIEYFSPKNYNTGKISITNNTYAIHHFNASWWTNKEKITFKIKKNIAKLLGSTIADQFSGVIFVSRKKGILYTFLKVMKILRNKILTRISRVIPLSNTIVLESLNGMDSNTGALFDYLLENNYNLKYKFYWLVDDPSDFANIHLKNVHFLQMYKSDYNFVDTIRIATAKYLIWDNKEIRKWRKDQKSVFLTHGSPTIKYVKHLIKPSNDLDYFLCPSHDVIDLMTDQVNVGREKTVVFGHPRNDYLFSENDEINKIVNETNFEKTIIWMPTFRQSKDKTRNDSNRRFELGIPLLHTIDELYLLNDELKNRNILLIIKIHPGADEASVKNLNLSNIYLLFGSKVREFHINLYMLIGKTDALLTDYSSVSFDYLLTGKQIGYIIDDIDDYKLGFAVKNPLELMPGKKIITLIDLLEFIRDVADGIDNFENDRLRIRSYSNEYHDNLNRERLVKFLEI